MADPVAESLLPTRRFRCLIARFGSTRPDTAGRARSARVDLARAGELGEAEAASTRATVHFRLRGVYSGRMSPAAGVPGRARVRVVPRPEESAVTGAACTLTEPRRSLLPIVPLSETRPERVAGRSGPGSAVRQSHRRTEGEGPGFMLARTSLPALSI